MASPLHVFRRYQKALIAGGIVMLMIAFAVTSVPNNFMEGQRRGDAVVFTTRKGEVREEELRGMMHSRRMAHQFLHESVTLAVRNLMQQRELQSIPPGQIFEILVAGLTNDGIDVRRGVEEESFVLSLIIARKAEEVGISVSDEAINEFLRDRTLKKVTPEQFRKIIADLKIPQRALFDALRLELLASRLRQMVFAISAVRGTPPGLRWDYFERLNHRASAQTMGLPVDGFLAQVGNPDEAQLQALYKEHKDHYAFPGSEEPGFHEPEKGKFEYFKADYEKFAAAIEVSEADILDYYEKNKQTQFLYSGFQTAPPKTITPAAEGTPAADGKAPADDASSKAPTETAPPAATESAPEAKAETPAPTTPAPTTPPTEPAVPAEPALPAEPAVPAEPALPAEPAAPQGESAPQSNGPQGAGGDDAGGNEAGGQPTESTTESPAAEAKTEQPAATEEPALSQPATTDDALKADAGEIEAAAKAEEKSDGASGDAKAKESDEKKAEEKPAEPALPVVEPDETLMLPESILGGTNPDYEPLWRVEDRIRDLLRRQRVGEKVREVYQRLGELVDDYSNKVADHAEQVGDVGAAKAGPAPTPPDLAAAATEAGVTFHTTSLISSLDAGETELGKSFLNGNQPFSDAAFASLRLWIPRQSVDVDGNQFLFWKVDEKHDFVPTYEEALEAVTRAWRFQQARELALKKAKELAEQVNTSGKTLKEVFGDAGIYQVNETGEFSWLTESAARSPEAGQAVPELSELPGVDSPGDDFMRTVFTLQPPQAGAALNAPQTVAYVVQVTSFAPADVVLRESFMVAPYRTYMAAAMNDERELVQNWVAQLEREAGLDWVRPPNQDLR